MIIPSRRKLGVAALIAAGIGAFLVPFLLHSSSTQGTSNNNNNSNSHTTPPTTTTTTTNPGTTPPTTTDDDKGSGGGNTGTCSESKAKDPGSADNGDSHPNGNAWGVLKNKMDTTVALVKTMGTHNSAFHLHHDTDTDNDKGHGPKNIHDPGDHDSSCAAGEEKHE